AIYPNDDNNTEDLLRKADLAMYKSKNCGKNTYEFYTSELNIYQHRESEVQSHLRQALHNDEFELYYQPKYDLIDQQLVGAEILLRWNNPTLGLVHPEEFIPIAENTGLIVDLGQWVIRKACQQILGWSNHYQTFLSFSINISPVQLSQHHFITQLKDILNEYNYPTEYLEFEITENSLMDAGDHITYALNELSILGIKLALDDFGKGYSSLSRLKSLPIDTLKIDKEFISDIQYDNKKVIIVDIIIKLATELGMSIVAEGIETEQQLCYLKSKKCGIGQGFLLSKPIPAAEFVLLAYNQKKNEFAL
ncbi:MAG: putative bifunctional diguanylate cyclase/phosphodiesterase, partial [Legionella sp.]